MHFPSIRIEGATLSADILDRIEQGDAVFQKPKDFGFENSIKVKDEIADTWAAARAFWLAYQVKVSRLPENARGTTETRNLFIVPLLNLLGYQLELSEAETVNHKSYAISHRDTTRDGLPVHIMGWRDELDKRRRDSGPRLSPHALLQEYLNLTEHLYGLVTNGRQVRLLRDSSRLIKLSFVEFDFERMFEEELYADFAIFFRLLHISRLPTTQSEASASIIETYHQDALASGSRIREGLRDAVESSMHSIANGLLAENKDLRQQVDNDELKAENLHHALLRLIYRLLFLMVIEERQLIHTKDVPLEKRRIYFDHYSIQRLRKLADTPHLCDGRKTDLWQGLSRTLSLFEESGKGLPLGIQPLGSELFSTDGIAILLEHQLPNQVLLKALRSLSLFPDPETKQLRRVNYAALDVEELGSIYESLLELQPSFDGDDKFRYQTLAGSERKTTGSYYTPAPLVQELIKSALIPVLDANLKKAETTEEKEKALLATRVCDPACGSGAFLIAATHYLAARLAEIRAGEDAHSPDVLRHALRDVVSHCIFGVDINPLSVELCKVSLWLLAIEPGKPLSFISHHIRCGNSLLGTNPVLISQGIPNAAYKVLTGDTGESVNWMKGLNKDALKGQGDLFSESSQPWQHLGNLPAVANQLETEDDDTIDARKRKEQTYRQFVEGASYENARLLADTWCAAFVWPKNSTDYGSELTTDHLRKIEKDPYNVCPKLRDKIKAIASDYRFFHWHLEFPAVFRITSENETPDFPDTGLSGGFDVMLGNPPWDKINLKDEEFFAISHPHIAKAKSKTKRKKLIEELRLSDPVYYKSYHKAQSKHDRTSLFLRVSDTYPLTGLSRINLYSVFAELNSRLIQPNGRVGLVIASGIATDDNNKHLFGMLVKSNRIHSILDFENRELFFKDVDSRYRFCLFTVHGKSGVTEKPDFAFGLTNSQHIADSERHFTLNFSQLNTLNPTSGTCPAFKNGKEAALSAKIYAEIRNWSSYSINKYWPGIPKTPFNMSNDSALFVEHNDQSNDLDHLSLYESKFIHQFNHRYASVHPSLNGEVKSLPSSCLTDPNFTITPNYRLSRELLRERFPSSWFLCYRMITNASNERTCISAIIPEVPCGHSLSILEKVSAPHAAFLLGNTNSLVFDYCSRQKVAGTNFSHWIWKQLPFPKLSEKTTFNLLYGELCLNLAIELTYSSWDLAPFAKDCGYDGPPFRWDEDRRHKLRCELDALFFHLYLPCDDQGNWLLARITDGAVRDETAEELATLKSHFPKPRDAVEYIMETFPIVKRKDIARTEVKDDTNTITQPGTYITKDRILALYDAMLQARQQGKEWHSPLEIAPASFRNVHKPHIPTEARPLYEHPEDLWNEFMVQFIRQTGSEATLTLLAETWRRFANISKQETHIENILNADELNDWKSHSTTKHSREGFHQHIQGSITTSLLSMNADTLVLSIPGNSALGTLAANPWTTCDVALSLAILANDPQVEKWLPSRISIQPEERNNTLTAFNLPISAVS